jgi:hypothetical protein
MTMHYLLEILDGVPLAEGLRLLAEAVACSERVPGTTTWGATEPGVTLRRIDSPSAGPFITSPAAGEGLVRLLALARPLLVTELQAAEAEAILGEPDKEDPARRAWLEQRGEPVSAARGYVLTTDPLGSGDAGLDASYGRLVAASRPKGKARVVRVDRTDLGSVLEQFRILVEYARRDRRA